MWRPRRGIFQFAFKKLVSDDCNFPNVTFELVVLLSRAFFLATLWTPQSYVCVSFRIQDRGCQPCFFSTFSKFSVSTNTFFFFPSVRREKVTCFFVDQTNWREGRWMIVEEGPWRPHNSLSTQRLSCCGVRKVSADRWRRRSQNIGERGALLPKQKVQASQKVSGQSFWARPPTSQRGGALPKIFVR